MITALQHARETLPRPTTSYREVEPSAEKRRFRATRRNSITKPSPFSSPPASSSGGGAAAQSTMPQAAAAATTTTNSHLPPTSANPTPVPSSTAQNNNANAKKAAALRTAVVIHQRIKEKPTTTITPSAQFTPTTIGERTNSFLPGSPFSFAIHGSIYDDDAAIIRIPDNICLTISSASVDAKSMEVYLHQKGALGVSLKLSTEENPQLLPIWTFDKDKSSSFNISNLGIRVAGPRNIRLGACMEMGYRSGASVDVYVFGSVTLDSDKF